MTDKHYVHKDDKPITTHRDAIPSTHATDAQRAGMSEEAFKKLSDEDRGAAVRRSAEDAPSLPVAEPRGPNNGPNVGVGVPTNPITGSGTPAVPVVVVKP